MPTRRSRSANRGSGEKGIPERLPFEVGETIEPLAVSLSSQVTA
jgi:hypothetical protein